MFKRTKISQAAGLALSGVMTVAISPAMAQDATQRIEITGSSIKRIDAEGALPVTVLKKEDIARTGATSTTDLLQRLPGIQGSFGESGSVGGGNGFASVSVHNIGDTRTLVLLNGRRLAQWGGQTLTGFGAGMDLNAIPISAIARVEVLTDGASALYGADAIAGVVNFITVSNSTEGDLTVGVSMPKDGARETRISGQKGFGSLDTDGFNVMLTASYDERTKLDSVDRDFAKSGKIFFNANGKKYRFQQFSPSPIPANALDDQSQLISPYQKTNGSCPDKTFRVIEPYNDGSGLVDDYCGFDFVGELEIYPIRERGTIMGSGTWRVGKHDLFAEALFSRTQSISRIAPVPGSISIPAGTPLHDKYLTPIGITGDSLAFYRLYDLGKREDNDVAKFMDIALGSKGEFMGWDYNASYSHSRSESEKGIAGYPGALAVGRLRSSGLLDPFVGPGQQTPEGQAAIDATSYKGYWDGGTSDLDVLQLHGSREIMALPAGPMMLGLGASYQKEKFNSKPSLFAQAKLADPVAGTLCDPTSSDPAINQCDQRFGDEAANIPYSANRASYAFFGEVVAPVVKGLELIGSVRYDHYDDFGGATTAKGSFRYTPLPNLLFRGSVGTGFHAPTVPQVNAASQPYGVTSEPYTCTPELQQIATDLGAQCQPGNKQYDVIAGGNPNLQPEKSQQASIGMRFDPTPQLSFGADLWHVNIEDAFGQVAEDELFRAPLTYRGAWTTKKDTGTGVVYLASLQSNLNLGKEYFTGLDLDFVGRFKTDWGNATSQLTGTYMIREERQVVPDGPYYSPIGNHNDSLGFTTFRWQGRWTNALASGNWNHALVMNFKAGYKDTTTTVDIVDDAGNVTGSEDIRFKVGTYVTFDWQSRWAFRKDMLLSVGLLNVFDRDPPLSISTGGSNRGQQFGYDDRYYDPRGRTFYADFSYKF
jgi:iron complex outermembrane receptor protein